MLSCSNSASKKIFAVFILVTVGIFYGGYISMQGEPLGILRSQFQQDNIAVGYTPRLKSEVKRILYWTNFFKKKIKESPHTITCGKNKEYTCELSSEKAWAETSHAIIFHGWPTDLYPQSFDKDQPTTLPKVRYPDQYYVFYLVEPPPNYEKVLSPFDDAFNWTMTYRPNSEAFVPYGSFHPLSKPLPPLNLTEFKSKTKLIAWAVSNCKAPSRRSELIKILSQHVPVDIYGKCGNLTCPKENCKGALGKQYKFYLSLENNICQDYMTEKVFEAYEAGMVPIIYGGANYNIFLPPGSFINMNSFPSAASLAEYLRILDRNPEQYAKYFEWRRHFKLHIGLEHDYGDCQICEKLHRDYPLGIRKIISNVTHWMYEPDGKYQACKPPLDW